MAMWGLLAATAAGVGGVAACDAGGDKTSNLIGAGASGVGGGTTTTTTNTSSTTGLGGGFDPGGGGNNGGTVCDSPGGNADYDGDGYSQAQGDCNDCDPNVNPGAIEVVEAGAGGSPPADENCNNVVDEPFAPCDSGFAIGDTDATHAAQALDICATVAADHFGLVSAQWVRANGGGAAPGANVGLLDGFGQNMPPRLGSRMVGISSGYARDAGDAGNCGGISCSVSGAGTAPAGFPQDVPGCSGGTNINDDVGLEVTLKAPTNATGFGYDFTFYSFEYPEWVCTTFNDQYIALVSPPPAGSVNGNISFDSQTNPVSVNIAFFNVCAGCPLGTADLAGTGFDQWDDAGATGWLQSQAPIGGGDQFTIRFAIWDTGDTAWDSTALLDNFRWIANGGTVSVGTIPVPQ
ncbi:MAG: putative metal-binding motif-containing protein [Polyangiaceae bacterium]|nr:putative metal-binding motif-containing protein [Polyangiaceae bacterium]